MPQAGALGADSIQRPLMSFCGCGAGGVGPSLLAQATSMTANTMPPAMRRALMRGSFHRRDHEFGALLDAGWPARGNRLGLGVEADRIRAMLVEIAKTGPFPAAKGVVGERHGNGEIHA